MAREKKFNFIPASQLQEKITKDRRPTVRINKNGQMVFSRTALEEFGLLGRFISLYADPQKSALGWHIFEGSSELQDLRLRKLEKNASGTVQIGVSKLLKKMGIKLEKPLSDLLVQKYEDLTDRLTFFYVIVRDVSEDVEEEPSIFTKKEKEFIGHDLSYKQY